MSRAWAAGSRPSTEVLPSVGGSNPSKILIRVDFPAPFAPTRPVTPVPAVTVRRSSAVTRGKRLVSPSVARMVMEGHYPSVSPDFLPHTEDLSLLRRAGHATTRMSVASRAVQRLTNLYGAALRRLAG